VPKRAAPLAWKQNESARAHGRGGAATAEQGRKLSRHAIVDAAIRLADADGLDAVTVRRLAAELDVKPMSLYVHIAAKADLLALMANELIGQMLVDAPLPEGWREALTELSQRMHAVYVAHPWAPEIFTRRPGMGPNAVRRAKQLARAVASLGLEPSEVWTLLAIVDDYVIGNALRVATGANERGFDSAMSAGDVVEFPELAELPRAELVRSHIERFETGLQAVLDGVEQRFLGSKRKR
jgi:AcrR family transcriptional regulator